MSTTNRTMTTTIPRTRLAKNEDGRSTGMLVTLADAVALDMHGNEKAIPAGSLISRAISGGFDARINSMSSCHKLGIGGEEITFRAAIAKGAHKELRSADDVRAARGA